MALIRICESDDFVVDYDKERGMYRVSYFENYHFKDEFWFDAYEEKECKYLEKECDHNWMYHVESTGGTQYRCTKCGSVNTFPRSFGF